MTLSLLLGTSAAGAARPAEPTPRFDFRDRTLANGLRVLSIEDHSTPTVAINVWYHVGSKDDPDGRSGFAHLFEHMMFKATRHMHDEQIDRLTEDVGGMDNAFTADDMTVYYEVVPSNYLETLLWAEAERLSALQVNEKNFFSERDVVEEEFRQSYLASPYGRLELEVEKRSWAMHPYRRPTIGNIEQLDAATLEDVAAFHAAYYRPDNATLVVVGDFDPQQLDGWVDRYFDAVPRPAAPIARVTAEEPPRQAEFRHAMTAPNVPLPAVAYTYLAAPETHEDAPALTVAAAILSYGESSRLYHSLVYDRQVASEAEAEADLREDAGLFTFTVVLASGAGPEETEAALDEEIERMRALPVPAEELEKAKNVLVTDKLRELETNNGKALELGHAAVILGDANRMNTALARLQAVTAGDVQRVMRRYLDPKNRVVIVYTDEAARPADDAPAPTTAAEPAHASPPAPASPSAAASPPAPASLSGPASPPAPAPPRAVRFATPVETTLANGLRVIAVERRGVPLVAAELAIRSGAETDPPRLAGRADFTAALLTKGTATRTAPEIAASMEALGGSLEGRAGWDASWVGTTVMPSKLEPALELLADVVRHPVFDEHEIERYRAQAEDDLSIALSEPGSIARFVAARIVFGDAPYGHPAGGTPASLAKLMRSDIAAMHEAYYRPDNAVLIVGGDIAPDAVFALAERLFGDWAKPPAALPRVPPLPADFAARAKGRVIVIDEPDAGQAAVMLVRPGIRRTDADYYPGVVANAVLGGGYSARLNAEIRVKRGLSYGAGSRLDARRDVGPFTASTQTKNPSAAEVAGLLSEELERLGSEDVPPAELAPRQASLTGGFARRLETIGGLVAQIAEFAVQELPLDTADRFISAVGEVSPAAVKRFARGRLAANGASIVIVGDAREFLDALEDAFPEVAVIDVEDLDLDSVSLVRAAAAR